VRKATDDLSSMGVDVHDDEMLELSDELLRGQQVA
jgi:hypothetical protein